MSFAAHLQCLTLMEAKDTAKWPKTQNYFFPHQHRYLQPNGSKVSYFSAPLFVLHSTVWVWEAYCLEGLLVLFPAPLKSGKLPAIFGIHFDRSHCREGGEKQWILPCSLGEILEHQPCGSPLFYLYVCELLLSPTYQKWVGYIPLFASPPFSANHVHLPRQRTPLPFFAPLLWEDLAVAAYPIPTPLPSKYPMTYQIRTEQQSLQVVSCRYQPFKTPGAQTQNKLGQSTQTFVATEQGMDNCSRCFFSYCLVSHRTLAR